MVIVCVIFLYVAAVSFRSHILSLLWDIGVAFLIHSCLENLCVLGPGGGYSTAYRLQLSAA